MIPFLKIMLFSVFLTGCDNEIAIDGYDSGASFYESGIYSVGEDISPGEFFVETTRSAASVKIICRDTEGANNVILQDDISTHRFVELAYGQYFLVRNGRFISAEDTPNLISGNIVGEGMYRVGIDFPAGEYRIRATHSTVKGYIKVATCKNGRPENIVEQSSFEGERWITLENGQYITVSRAELMLN